jgi:hypothetical protein
VSSTGEPLTPSKTIVNKHPHKQFPITAKLLLELIVASLLLSMLLSCFDRHSRREENAVITLRVLREIEKDYAVSHDGRYGTLEQILAEDLIDIRFAGPSPVVHNYRFSVTVIPPFDTTPSSYSIDAVPVRNGDDWVNEPGDRVLHVDSSHDTVFIEYK